MVVKLRLGVLVSGRGSNLQAIIDSVETGELPAEVVVVVSNHRDVPALERAAKHGVPFVVIERRAYPCRQAQHSAIGDVLTEYRTGLVVLAGFDRILDPELVRRFLGRIINVHPSLLPAFAGGLHAQEEAWRHGAKISGCTVHLVTDELDGGPIIIQRAVPILEEDTAATLAARILVEEHRALPEAIRLLAFGRLRIEGRRVRVV